MDEWLKHAKAEKNYAIFKLVTEKMNFQDAVDGSIRKLNMQIARMSTKIYEKFQLPEKLDSEDSTDEESKCSNESDSDS